MYKSCMYKEGKKRFIFYVITYLFVFILSICAAEILLWLVKPKIAYKFMPQKIVQTFFSPDKHSEFGLKPNYYGQFLMSQASFDSTVKTNSFGWRDREPDKRKKIPVFGDSFTFGYGVNNGETIPDYLEMFAGRKIDFINLGYASGRSPDSYAVWLRNRPSLHNKTVLVILFKNDLNDLLMNQCMNKSGEIVELSSPDCIKIFNNRYLLKNGSLEVRSVITEHLPMWLIRFLKRSYLIGFIRDRLFEKEVGKTNTSIPFNCDIDSNKDFRRFTASLDILKEYSGSLILVTIGSDESYYECVKAYTELNNLLYINIPDFDSSYYWKNDGHYNQKGCLKAAKIIYKAISAEIIRIEESAVYSENEPVSYPN